MPTPTPTPTPTPAPVPTPAPAPTAVVIPKVKPLNGHELACKRREKIHEAKLKKLKEVLFKATQAAKDAKTSTSEKKVKFVGKVELAQKKVEMQAKVITKNSEEQKIKGEKSNKMESVNKKTESAESKTKFQEAEMEKKNKATLEKMSKESVSKVKTFKANEAQSKKVKAEKKNKNPFINLSKYCAKLKKMEDLLVKSKELDSKKLEGAHKESASKSLRWETKYVEQGKKLKEEGCKQTKETCFKISTTSEYREKHAAKLANERSGKLSSKFQLARKFDAGECKRVRFAVCAAAHGEIQKLLEAVTYHEKEEAKLLNSHLRL